MTYDDTQATRYDKEMSRDDPLSAANRKALQARKTLVEKRPELANSVRGVNFLQDCLVIAHRADRFYHEATEAYIIGDVGSGDAALAAAHSLMQQYHACVTTWIHVSPFPK